MGYYRKKKKRPLKVVRGKKIAKSSFVKHFVKHNSFCFFFKYRPPNRNLV